MLRVPDRHRCPGLMYRRTPGLCVLLACGLALAAAAVAQAQVKVVAWYYLGDVDNDAKAGQPIHETVEAGRKAVLTLRAQGDVAYTDDVPPAARRNLKDILAAQFGGKDGRLVHDGVLTVATDNFGIEAWVKPQSDDGFHYIVQNGGDNGFAIVRNGKAFQGFYPGVATIGWSGDFPTGQWVHLALVRDSGKTTLYVDGRACGGGDQAPVAPGSGEPFTIGARSGKDEEFFQGTIDEVRLFTFAPGKFSIQDLLLNRKAH